MAAVGGVGVPVPLRTERHIDGAGRLCPPVSANMVVLQTRGEVDGVIFDWERNTHIKVGKE